MLASGYFFSVLNKYIDSLINGGPRERIPLYIELKHPDCPIGFNDMISFWWQQSGIIIDKSVTELLHTKKLFLFLDGLNELPEKSKKKRIASIYAGVQPYSHEAYEGPILLACRTGQYSSYLTLGIKALHILPLNAQGLITFVNRNLKKNQRHEFLNHIVEQPERVDLTSSLLSLNILKELYLNGHLNLPLSRPKLYEKYIDELFKDYNLIPIIGNQMIDLEKLKADLRRLAFNMWRHGKTGGLRKAVAIDMARKNVFDSGMSVEIAIELNLLKVSFVKDNSKHNEIILHLKQFFGLTYKDNGEGLEFFHRTMYEHLITEHAMNNEIIEYETELMKFVKWPSKRQLNFIERLWLLGVVSTIALPQLLNFYFDKKIPSNVRDACRKSLIDFSTESRSGVGVFIVLTIILDNALTLYNKLVQSPDQEVEEDLVVLKADLYHMIHSSLKETYIDWRAAQLHYREQQYIELRLSARIFDPRVTNITEELNEYLQRPKREENLDKYWSSYETSTHMKYHPEAVLSFENIKTAYSIVSKNMALRIHRTKEITSVMINHLDQIRNYMIGREIIIQESQVQQEQVQKEIRKYVRMLSEHVKSNMEELTNSKTH